MSLWKYVYRAVTEPLKKVSPVFDYARLASILLLLAWYVYWRNNLPPDYPGDRYGNAVVGLMLLFNLLAFQFRWPILATVIRTLVFIWLVFVFVYIAFRFGHTIRVGEPNEPIVVQALEAVDRFHSGVKQQRYQDICQAAESGALLAVTSLSCPEFLLYFHQKLGDPVSARRTQLPSIGDRRSDGTVTVELGYKTEYENGTAHERFDWRIKGTAVILKHYDAEADALSQ
jgi:hypothetical protein